MGARAFIALESDQIMLFITGRIAPELHRIAPKFHWEIMLELRRNCAELLTLFGWGNQRLASNISLMYLYRNLFWLL